MPSPFPGMDPYLEDPAFWPDFHLTFIGCWREAIADVLPDACEARLDETIHIVPLSQAASKAVYPDVAVSRRRPRNKTAGATREPATALLEPIVIPHEATQKVRQARIEILHRPKRRLVPVLEMLSPTNKTGEGFVDYCAKRVDLLARKTHLVELDLLIGGRRLPLSRPLPSGDYYAFVSRSDRRPDCEVYAWRVREPLPRIPIPLLKPDADITVGLPGVFRAAYARGRYRRSLAYGHRPPAPLKGEDRAWARRQA